MLDVSDSGQEIENHGFDKDFNKEMLWFWSTGRMLDFRDSGQETENDGFDKDFNKEVYGFEPLFECMILGILVSR